MARASCLFNPYQTAADLADSGKTQEGFKIISARLIDDPNDIQALVTGSYIARMMGALPVAYHFAKAATQIRPTDCPAWTNWGHTASQMWLIDEAEAHYMKALECAKSYNDKRVLWVNLSALYLDNGEWDKAETYVRKVLDDNPEDRNAIANLGFIQLARGEWDKGWKGYHNTIGSDWRPKVQYKDEPEWDGTPGKTVALYADQGLGDEISFASMVPDAADICRKVVLDCDSRLEGLFRRSFPQVKVYGTRTKTTKWAPEDRNIDASLPLGQIGEFFRTSRQSFPGTPYLVPCPDRTTMWRSLFASKGKPCIGVAWTGGSPKTNARNRRISLQDLLPVFRNIDAHFVSLQYKDASAEIAPLQAKGIDIAQYAFGTLTDDYDDTAALIASLDYVLCIQTAVAHAAGALGTPATVLVPVATQWRYGNRLSSIPWYDSLRVIHQEKTGSWAKEIERAGREIKSYLRQLPGRAAEATRDDHLRDGIHRLRADGLLRRESSGDYSSP